MKRILSLVLVLCLCLGYATFAVADEEKVELRFMWWGSQTRHDRTIAAIEMYMAENPNVTISYEFMGFNDYFTKLSTLAASNDVPDVFQMGNNFLTYQDIIEPLEPYIEKGLIDVSSTNDAYLSTTRINGIQMGISLGVNSLAMIYDPAIFAAADVAEPTTEWTWAEFEEASKVIHEKTGLYGSSKFNDFFIGMVIGIPQYGTGETAYNSEGTALGYTDDSYVSNFLAMKKRLQDAGAYPAPGEIAAITDPENDLLTTGKAAIGWLNSNQLVAMINAAGRELKITTPPKQTADGVSGLCIRSAQAMSIYNGSEHKEEAAKFLNWFVNDVEANLILNGERGVPIMGTVRDAIRENCDPVADAATIDTYEFIDLAGSLASNPPPMEPAVQLEVEDLLNQYNERVMFDVMSPEEAAAEFRLEVEAAFERTAQ